MTIDERRVTTALREYARGVEVTEEDLDRLEARVGERLHPASRRDRSGRPWEWAVAACAVVALVLAVTALWRTRAEEALPATSTITPTDLAGVWLSDAPRGGGWLWHFTADGRIGFSNTAKAYVTVNDHRKPFTLEGDVLDFPESGQRCRATVQLSAEGRMTLTPALAPAEGCDLLEDGGTWDFVRVSPASVAGATLVASPNEADRRPATEPKYMTDVAGTWLFEGTGTVLVVVRSSPREGEYFLDGEGDGVQPDQRGTVVLPPEGGIVLRPAGGTEQGCDTVFASAGTTGVALEVELAESSCGRLGAERGTWVRLSRPNG